MMNERYRWFYTILAVFFIAIVAFGLLTMPEKPSPNSQAGRDIIHKLYPAVK